MSDLASRVEKHTAGEKWLRAPDAIHHGWRCRWQLADLIAATTPETVGATARELHTKLETLRVESYGGRWASDEEIEQLSDELHTLGFVDRDEVSAHEFEMVLNAIYDWADRERVLIS